MQKKKILQKVIAHRGMSGDFPENTQAAFAAAKNAGIKWIETDVSMLKDETLVIFHDKKLGRTVPGSQSLSTLTWQDVEALDVGIWRGDEFEGQKVLRVEDCMSWIIENDMRIILEMKVHDKHQQIAAQRLRSRLATTPRQYFILSSFDLDFLGHYRQLDLTAQLASIHWELPSNIDHIIRRLSLVAVNVDHRSISSEREIQSIKRSGAKACAWTVNDAERASELFRLGVDMLISDFPERLFQC